MTSRFTALIPLHKWHRNLDCPTLSPISLPMFRVLLDTLCEATGTTPGIELIGHYPCGDPSWLSRSAFLFKQLPTALHSFISATHPLTGPYPNEIWALSPLVFIIPASCLAVTSPQLGLKLRSWLWMLSSLACSVTPLIGLLTHPNHPPSTYWTSCLPVCGALLQAHRIIFRVRGRQFHPLASNLH